MTQQRASAFGELDIWLARAGRHEELWAKLGAHLLEEGVRFAVWAPNAHFVSVVGDFNDWDPAADPLTPVAESGIWEGIVDGATVGQRYKYHLDGREKADPLAFGAHTAKRTPVSTGCAPSFAQSSSCRPARASQMSSSPNADDVRLAPLPRACARGRAPGCAPSRGDC